MNLIADEIKEIYRCLILAKSTNGCVVKFKIQVNKIDTCVHEYEKIPLPGKGELELCKKCRSTGVLRRLNIV